MSSLPVDRFFQWATAIKIQLSVLVKYKTNITIISSKMSCCRHDMDEQLVFGRLATICNLLHVSKSFTASNQYVILVLYFIFVDVSDNFFKKRKCNDYGENNVLNMLHIFCNWPPWYNWNIAESGILITRTLTPLQLINVHLRRKPLTVVIVCMSRYPSIISILQLN
jgi:hypothetical protein